MFQDDIEVKYKMYRGVTYTDSLGVKWNMRYMPVVLRNTGSSKLQIDVAFPDQEVFKLEGCGQTFKSVPLPDLWSFDGTDITSEMFDDIPKHLASPFIEEILMPSEEMEFALATLYSQPVECGLLPTAVVRDTKVEELYHCKHGFNPRFEKSSLGSLFVKLDYFEEQKNEKRCVLVECVSFKKY